MGGSAGRLTIAQLADERSFAPCECTDACAVVSSPMSTYGYIAENRAS